VEFVALLTSNQEVRITLEQEKQTPMLLGVQVAEKLGAQNVVHGPAADGQSEGGLLRQLLGDEIDNQSATR
jgi:hypothetical protein